MLSARYLLLHQALDLGPMWLNDKARLVHPEPTAPKQETTTIKKPLERHTPSAPTGQDKNKTEPPKMAFENKPEKKFSKPIDPSGKNLSTLAQETLSCKACRLSLCRKQPIFSKGNPEAQLLVLTTNPTPEDDLAAELLYGEAGALLQKMLAAIKINIEDTYLTSMVKCAPSFGEEIEPEQIEICQVLFNAQLDLVKPKAILALGTDLTNWAKTEKENDLYFYKNTPFFLTPHPARLMRHPQEKAQAWETLKKLRDFLLGLHIK